MTNNPQKQRLELTWIGKTNPEYDIANVEPRILEERTDLSYGDPNTENMIVHGDNLLALKALLPEYEGKIKCIYIDPPYNTGSAFEHYDDGVEHSIWLGLMRPRLELFYKLLTDDGSLWISIDDNEAHYLKVLCDEIFGRKSFVTAFIWKKVDSPNDNKVSITPDHEYVLCFSKKADISGFKQRYDESILNAYHEPDSESDRPYRDRLLKKNGKSSLRSDRPSMFFPIIAPDGSEILPIHDDGRQARWALAKKSVDDLLAKQELIWKKRSDGTNEKWVPYTREYAPLNPSRPHPTIWNDLDTTRQTKAHQKILFGEEFVFATPKPENLLHRILEMCTDKGDLIMDSFAGSGTTGATAHKMDRRWIMVELEDHAFTHVHKRLTKVVDGMDEGGITETVTWKGGGGFKFYELAPSFIVIDEFGNPVIDSYYNDTKLIRAMCKLMSYKFSPSNTEYWKHGKGQGNNGIYVTTQMLSVAMVQQIASHLTQNESLLICPKKYEPGCKEVDNRITIKKIPQSVLKSCQFGKKEYLLPIRERTMEEIDEEDLAETQE